MHQSVSSSSGKRSRRTSGFALLITITLLAFLVLLLVSLASLTRVETQVASNSQQLTQARQNALLALNLAVGQLQTLAGPDQRATASADLGDGGTATTANKLVVPKPGARAWTGVWGNRNAWGASTTQPGLLNWLVSGNENVAVTAKHDPSDTTTFGQITSTVPTVPFAPDGALPTITNATTTTDDLGDWRLLVGSKTAGADASHFVVAPAKTITVQAGTLPGFALGDTTPTTIGRYAWWVGDEGVKATVSLVDPITTRTTVKERSYSFITTQRIGVERVTPDYPVNSSLLESVLSLQQLPLSVSGATARTNLTNATKDHVYDFTSSSMTVLADSSRGGLKKDLTAWVDHGDGMADTDPIVPGTGSDYAMPQWGIIRTYANRVDDGAAQAPAIQSASQEGLNPVITYVRLGFGLARNPVDNTLRILLFPTVVLWNPTNVTINGEYELCFSYRDDYPDVTFTVTDTTGVDVSPARTQRFIFPAGGKLGAVTIANRIFYRFKIATHNLPPGRSLMYALKSPDQVYQAGQNLLAPLNGTPTPGDETLSAFIETPLVVNLGEQIKWDNLKWSSTAGSVSGTLDVVLRTPLTTDLPVRYATILPDAYQAIQYLSFGSNSAPVIPTADPDATLGPIFHTYIEMQMADTATKSALRWMAHLNPRSRQSFRTQWSTGAATALYLAATLAPPSLPVTASGKAATGLEVSTAPSSGNPVDLVLEEFRPSAVPLFSIAQLQHANLSLLSTYPAYAVGNAISNPYLERTENVIAAANLYNTGQTNPLNYYDLSWHLNRALWDRYFFSTVPASGLTDSQIGDSTYHLPNARLAFHGTPTAASFGQSTAISTNAANLMFEGGFNVNSTSVAAWRTLLSSLHSLPYDPRNPTATTPPTDVEYPFTRYANPKGGESGTWSPNDPWGGFRSLTANAIDGLAQKIVDQIKKRGPFLSLADFVNRRLVEDDTASDNGTGFAGTIQAAIYAYDSTVTDNSVDAINRRTPFLTTLGGSSNTAVGTHDQTYWGGRTKTAPFSSHAANAPGYLTQADVLTALGPVLSARSDTFLIRTYGEVENPLTHEVTGRAWCEARVQRVPDYVQPAADSAETWPPTDTDNQTFGRRFEIVSFRWLSPDDI
ncbi:MAG: hypothetical protein WC205_08790 [Opitutaceae bacterium]|jgi:hypothetical protein